MILLVEAVVERKKVEAIDNATGMVVAVTHALDLAFNKGKGEVFEKWTRELLGKDMPVATSSVSKTGKKLMSERFEQFLGTMKRKDS